MTDPADELTVDDLNEIDLVCDRFERRLRSNDEVSLEAILESCRGLHHDELFVELLATELEVRAERQALPDIGDYIARFPARENEIRELYRPWLPQSAAANDAAVEPTGEYAAGTIAHSQRPDSTAARTPDRPQTTIGDYELLDEIARGGMGVVYKARQTSLNRIVALKMIKSGALADDDEVKRFQTEADAAAALDHPNIVPIYEVGEQDGLYYYSMGFVDGESLSDRLKDGPLPPREAAELVKTVAGAIACAHDHSVIHRDLKPANILIDRSGTPRVTDFGLAKRTTVDSEMTATGQILGTPGYMPPEQAQGLHREAAPAGDIYSLGALLYCLLTGRPPFQTASPLETLKQVIEREPVPPRQLNSSIHRDLETICLKCLQKNPQDRYLSARELVDELDRFLGGHPIVARPISRAARVWRWCRRNPLAAIVIVVLVFGSPLLTLEQMRLRSIAEQESQRANQEHELTKQALGAKQAALVVADERLLETEQTIDRYVATIRRSEFLRDARFKPAIKVLLQGALEHYRRYIDRHQGELAADARLRVAKAYFEIGGIHHLSGSQNKAVEAFQEAAALFGRLAREKPEEFAYPLHGIQCENNLGIVYSNLGKKDEAAAALRRAIADAERLLHKSPAFPGLRAAVATTNMNLASLTADSDRPQEAVIELNRALNAYERLASKEPGLPAHEHGVATAYHNLAVLSGKAGQPVAAHAAAHRAAEIWRRLNKQNAAEPKYRQALAECLGTIGALQMQAGDFKNARVSLREARGFLQSLARDNPAIAPLQHALAINMFNTGEILFENRQWFAALQHYQQAEAIWKELTGDHPATLMYQSSLATAVHNRGEALLHLGKLHDALTAFQTAVGLRRSSLKHRPNDTEQQTALAKSHSRIADVSAELNRPDEALAAHQVARDLRSKLMRAKPSLALRRDLAGSHNEIGNLHLRAKRFADALEAHQESLRIRTALAREFPHLTVHQRELADTHNNIGIIHSMTGEVEQALAAHRSALNIRRKIAQLDSLLVETLDELATSLGSVGRMLARLGSHQQALRHLHDCRNTLEDLLKQQPNDPRQLDRLVGIHHLIDSTLWQMNRGQEAIAVLDQAIAIGQRRIKRNPNDAEVKKDLQKSYWRRALRQRALGRHREAAESWQQAARYDPGRYRLKLQLESCRSLAMSGQHAEACRLARRLLVQKKEVDDLFTVTRVFALSSAAASHDEMLSNAERERLKTVYANNALMMLKGLARVTRYFSSAKSREKLRTEPDLNPIRHLAAFRETAAAAGVKLPAYAATPLSARRSSNQP